MRYFKSVLFIALALFFAAQTNANSIFPTVEKITEKSTIIDVIVEGRSIQVKNKSAQSVMIILRDNLSTIIYEGIISPNSTIELSNLPLDTYSFNTISQTSEMIHTIKIE